MYSSLRHSTCVMPFWRTVQRLFCTACSRSWMQRLVSLQIPKFSHVTAAMRDVLHWLPVRQRQRIHFKLRYIIRNCVVCGRHCTSLPSRTPCSCQRSCAASAATFCHLRWPHMSRVAIDRFGGRAFSVTGPQLWNQLPVTTRATSTNTSDCFRRALKAILFQCVCVCILLQLTAPLRNSSRGGGAIALLITLTLLTLC